MRANLKNNYCIEKTELQEDTYGTIGNNKGLSERLFLGAEET